MPGISAKTFWRSMLRSAAPSDVGMDRRRACDHVQLLATILILGQWFGTGDHIQELCSVTTGQVSEREHVAYRVRVRLSGSDYLVEQQAYYSTDGAHITWMRVRCSGYQTVHEERLAAR
jgi:hypothetical protein